MGKLYSVVIKNIITDKEYKIKSFGRSSQDVHKHVLFDVISRNETIEYIYLNKQLLFDTERGFFTEYSK